MRTKSRPRGTQRTRRARSGPTIVVQRAGKRPAPPAARLRAWARAALGPRTRAEITVRLVGAAEGRRLNRAYRGRDRATNVLSFAYAPPPPRGGHLVLRGGHLVPRGGHPVLCGDLVLCQPVIAREARAQGKPLAAHYAHMVVHGVLHLRGLDHQRAREAARMERAECRILNRLGFADPYVVDRPGRGR